MALHGRAGTCVDTGQCLTRIDNRKQRFVRLSACTVTLGDLERLPGEHQLVVATILRVPEQDLAACAIDVSHCDWWIGVPLNAVDLDPTATGKQLEAVVVRPDRRRRGLGSSPPHTEFLWRNRRWITLRWRQHDAISACRISPQ